MGGNIAGAYASRYPNDLKSLLLIAPGGVASSEPSEMFRRLKDGKGLQIPKHPNTQYPMTNAQ